MPAPLAITVVDQHASTSFIQSLFHDVLPVFALATGVIATIWLACAVIVISGFLMGFLVVYSVSALVDGCARYVRHRRAHEDTQLDTVDADSAGTEVVLLDRHRRVRQHQRPESTDDERTSQHRPDNDPA